MATTHNKKSKKTAKPMAIAKKPLHRRRWTWAIGVVLLLVFGVWLGFRVSPWPGTLVIRYFFDKGGKHTAAIMEKYVPSGIASISNQQYRAHDKDAYLDVYFPSKTGEHAILPTIVWVHGGAWVSGDKRNVASYLKILAAHGYTTVGVNYSIAPEKHYPMPVLQVNDALRYVTANAQRLHIDANSMALAGDSAGSQIAAQVATIITNPSYARQIGMPAPIKASQLKAMVLNCGAYDLTLPNYNGPDGKFLKTVLWAYAGTKNFLADPDLQTASVVDYVTHDFPPSFITAGNVDPLETQSREFAGKLTQLGVPVDALFYPANHQPQLQHEYQFNLDFADSQQALQRVVAFLQQRL